MHGDHSVSRRHSAGSITKVKLCLTQGNSSRATVLGKLFDNIILKATKPTGLAPIKGGYYGLIFQASKQKLFLKNKWSFPPSFD